MNYAGGLAALLLALALATQTGESEPAAPPASPAGPSVEAAVSRVIDGSSLDAHVQGRRVAIGYLGVETPFPHQPCGAEALARNRELAGARVLLVEDQAYTFDQAGRRLYYAYTPEGVSIEAVLISEGLARAARTDASRGGELIAVQAEAEASARGCLWGE